MKLSSVIPLCAGLLAAHLAFAAETTLTGKITDSMCDKDHSMMAAGGKAPDAKQCTLECVKAGSKFVLVSQGKVYMISNQDQPDLKTYAGGTVRLTGELSADGKSIKAGKLQAA